MKPILNHTYDVTYVKPTKLFEFRNYNSIVGYESYKERIIPKIWDVAYELHLNPNSRQAVINVNEGDKHMSCLMYYNFQIIDDTLHVTVVQRSQCEKWGKKTDIELACYVTYLLKLTSIFKLYYRTLKTEIHFVVNNYHRREDITA